MAITAGELGKLPFLKMNPEEVGNAAKNLLTDYISNMQYKIFNPNVGYGPRSEKFWTENTNIGDEFSFANTPEKIKDLVKQYTQSEYYVPRKEIGWYQGGWTYPGQPMRDFIEQTIITPTSSRPRLTTLLKNINKAIEDTGNTYEAKNIISNAVSTGKVDGQKLSSGERQKLSQILRTVNIYENQYNPNIIDLSRVGEPMDAVDLLRQTGLRWDSSLAPDFSSGVRNSIRNKIYDVNKLTNDYDYEIKKMLNSNKFTPGSKYSNLNNLSALKNISNELYRRKALYEPPIKNDFTGVYPGITKEDIRKDASLKQAVNFVIEKYGLTDPAHIDVVKALLPEWQGSLDSLVETARYI